MMKYFLVIIALVLLCQGCATTIAHKNIETHWKGYGVTVDYKSTVAIDPVDIPAFIKAVDKLEKLLEEK